MITTFTYFIKTLVNMKNSFLSSASFSSLNSAFLFLHSSSCSDLWSSRHASPQYLTRSQSSHGINFTSSTSAMPHEAQHISLVISCDIIRPCCCCSDAMVRYIMLYVSEGVGFDIDSCAGSRRFALRMMLDLSKLRYWIYLKDLLTLKKMICK